MTEFVPSGYISIREALNLLGHELFGSEWTGEEHKARSGLISADEWLKMKDLPGTGASGGGRPGATGDSRGRKIAPQTEYRAAQRHAAARRELRVRLEAGHLEAAILDPHSGELYRVPARTWRQHDADRIIKHGRAQKPSGGNIGDLLVKRFAGASVPAKPLPAAEIGEVIEALKQKIATESLTRSEQAEFVRKTYPTFHVSVRQMNEICRSVPVPFGRPRKSNKKV